MEYAHVDYSLGETIAAVATPPGEGGVAVIRISGPQALCVAAAVFSGPVHTYPSHTVHLGRVLDPARCLIDEALLLVMLSPRSYTGEDIVEIHCHGGTLTSRKVLDAVLAAGARAARPGEFTFRAFFNGKIDLAQAEAVQQVIGAKNSLALAAAGQQLQGRLSKVVSSFQKGLIDTAAILEAWVDFPEEDLEFATFEELISNLNQIKAQIEKLSFTFHEGRKIHHGISLCLSGPPNAGKSSLMNALLGKERAIVTQIAGTTRDLIEEELSLGHLHFRLIDTAGIRQTEELIEKEGIRRSKEAMNQADLILLVLDSSSPLCNESKTLLNTVPKSRTLLVWNKGDLVDKPITPLDPSFPHSVVTSAKTGEGLSLLKKEIHNIVWEGNLPSQEELLITNARHHQALNNAIASLNTLIDGLRNRVSPEFASQDMKQVLYHLNSIIGVNITEEILSAIFSKFCVGK